MTELTLYRKRLIPEECVLLKDDYILYADEEYIVTSWQTLRPKKDLHHGYSVYLLKQGVKVSKFLAEDNTLLCWYCDIVTYEKNEKEHSLTSVDLLADVIIEPNGFVKVVDLDELVQALHEQKINQSNLTNALLKLDWLLQTIYAGDFHTLTDYIERYATV